MDFTESQLLMIAAQARELVLAAPKVYSTPQKAMEQFERTGSNLVTTGAILTGSAFLAAGRILRLMLETEGMIEMHPRSETPRPRNPNAN